MTFLKEHINSLVLCLFEVVIGILLLIEPIGFTSRIIMIAGVVLIGLGCLGVIKYFKTSAGEAMIHHTLAKGILSMLAGAFCVFKTEWFMVTFPVLTILYGIIILMAGIVKIQSSVDLLRQKNKKWFWTAASAVISLICSMIIFKNPFASTAMLWIFTGVSLLAEGIFDITALILGTQSKNNMNI